MTRIKLGYLEVIVLFAIGIMAGLLLYYVPSDHDEYLKYRSLGCMLYSHLWDTPYNNQCLNKQVYLFGIIPWQLSWPYVGATYSLLYYPVFHIWPHWLSAKILDILIMLPGLYAALRVLKVRLGIMLLMLCAIFPILFYIVHDFGQLTIQLTLLYLLPWLTYRAVATSGTLNWIFLNIALGLLFAFGMESKPVLIYYTPSIIVVTLAICWPLCPSYKLIWLIFKRIWPSILLAATLLLILYSATVYSPNPKRAVSYYTSLTRMPSSHQTIGAYLEDTINLLSTFWLNFSNIPGFAPREHTLFARWPVLIHGYGFILTLPFWVCLGILIRKTRKHIKTHDKDSLNVRLLYSLMAACLIGVICISFNRASYLGHHVLQPFYYLLGAMAVMMQFAMMHYRKLFFILSTVLLFSQIAITGYVLNKTPNSTHDWGRFDVLNFLESHQLKSRSIIRHHNWGLYFISFLYGPSDKIEIWGPVPDRQIAQVAEKLNRSMTYPISFKSGAKPTWIASYLPGMRRVFVSGSWEVWTDADPDADILTLLFDGHNNIATRSLFSLSTVSARYTEGIAKSENTGVSYLPFDMPYTANRIFPWLHPVIDRAEYYGQISARIRNLVSIQCPPENIYQHIPVRSWPVPPQRSSCPLESFIK